jgi:hypothetical protein
LAADPGPGFRNLEGTCFPSGTREATFYVFGLHPSIVLGLPRLDDLRNNPPNFSSEDGPFRVWERPTFRPCLYFISLSRPQNCQQRAEINLHTITTAATGSGKRHRRSQAPPQSRLPIPPRARTAFNNKPLVGLTSVISFAILLYRLVIKHGSPTKRWFAFPNRSESESAYLVCRKGAGEIRFPTAPPAPHSHSHCEVFPLPGQIPTGFPNDECAVSPLTRELLVRLRPLSSFPRLLIYHGRTLSVSDTAKAMHDWPRPCHFLLLPPF